MLVAATLLLSALVSADVYMHNPRGSNDRAGEGNQNRNNANRLFDSQNNAQGGYGVAPEMKFYEGSWLTVEWTAQHACGNDNTHCQFILQYMCGNKDAKALERIRDGTVTDRIPDNAEEAAEMNEGGVTYVYGMHESYEYYQECNRRERNKGLFKADRNINGNSARFTRQNNNGNRYGFECNEERDYYPYWHPSPWKDIAVFTTDTSMCAWIREESQNVADKGHCVAKKKENKEDAHQYNNRESCENEGGHEWVTDMNHEMDAPECLKAPWSRDNHLGNGITDTLAGHMNHYNWSLPRADDEPCIENENCDCVLRLRYNISTADYEGRPMYPGYADHTENSDDEEEESEPLIEQDPYVTVASKKLALALNTNQYGRTFQDRSHVFSIRTRPSWLDLNQRIFNLNVRGKRGNIVQCYPAVEYDFVPTNLVARHWDYVHFQWTGFDDNPNNGNNNAEGTDGTDRHNLVQIMSLNHNIPQKDTGDALEEAGLDPLFSEISDRHRMAYLGQSECLDLQELLAKNDNNQNDVDEDEGNCMKLNAASPYFDGDVVRMNRTGTFYYMSTRNNNFSNRSQKGSMTVLPILSALSIGVVVVGALLCLGSIGVGYMVVESKRNPAGSVAQAFNRL
eukprot:CAMPEP_0170738014 /NCGR_PEP_ID=MMETSP0437-20130122/4429_1 /TAXON_ID=0 /ORGANISM="Sexangularia sp." /LENGTH=624 /DNA_ID=CAMNT_0011076429 /DNA_START=64 /DNA_END=1938 /DNA_ORIENTATION=-